MRTARPLERAASLALVALFASSCAHRSDAVVQYSTVGALLVGYYDGELSIGELSRHGDFGLGAVNALDGELVALDGTFHTARADGRLYALSGADRTPFAVVKHFDPELRVPLPAHPDYAALQRFLDGQAPDSNRIWAIRIQGHFRSLLVRSEPKQTPPYRPLAPLMREIEVQFRHEDVLGTLVGFRTPGFLSNLNVPGYHFHFVSDDRLFGGHVLEVETLSGWVELDPASELRVRLPADEAFSRLELTPDRADELGQVEHRGR